MSERYTLHLGDNLEALRSMPDDSIDAIVTDPPYGLSFMGKKWDYDVPSVETWRECLRVLKPGGHLLAFAGTRTQHRIAVNIEDAGFEIRDMIAWVYGSGFPKSLNLKDEWAGWGTALKPAMEPITVARKPLRGTVASNVLEYGTGGLNIDGCRVATDEQWNGYQLENDGKSVNAYGDGLNHRRSESHPHGRWPANLIHDGSEEVMELLDSAARFFYCAKASNADRNEGLEGFDSKQQDQGRKDGNPGGDNPRNRGLRKRQNHHPTVKPTDLMRYLCRLVTPPGGLILDPYMGSGSTGKAAMLEGFRFVGCEMEPEYMEIARARIAHAASQVVQQELL